MRIAFLRAIPCLVVLLGLLSGAGGCGADEEAGRPAAAALAISGLYPDFDRHTASYVSRCGRGAEPIQVDAGAGIEVEERSRAPFTGSEEVGSDVPPG
jgi:hypothetical protein